MIQRWDSPILIDDKHDLAPCRTHHGQDLNNILHLVTFFCDSIKPILGFLLGIVGICHCTCYLDRFFLFIVIMCLGEACLTTAGLVPAMLRAVMCDMPLLLTNVTGDICEILSHTV